MDKQKQRLEQLVRQGIVPVSKLPMLQSALANLNMGKELKPMERSILSKYITNIQQLVYGDDTVYNRAKLFTQKTKYQNTQKTKYQTEETTVDIDEKVRVVDGPEEDMEVRGREKAEMKARRLSIRKRDKYRLLSPELKKEKKKAGLDEDVVELNSTYQEMFEATLEYFEVSNIRDLPEEKKAVFFKIVDEALEEAKMAKKDHDGDGKVETSTAEYMGSRDKAIKKAMKKESFEDNEKRREKARADMAAGKYNKDGSRKVEVKKEEVEQVDELKKSTLSSYIQKAADPAKKKSNVNLASKAAYKLAKDPDMGSNAGEKEDRKAYMRSKGIQTAAKKLAKEEVAQDAMIQQVNEYITSKQVKMAKGIANDPRHKGGDYSGAAEKMEKIKKGLSNHPAAKKALQQANEELTPQQKTDRMKIIARAADRVQSGAAAKDAEKRAKKDMAQKGAQKGMAPTKKDVEEQVQELRKMIREGNDKIGAYKLLNKILNNKENLGE